MKKIMLGLAIILLLFISDQVSAQKDTNSEREKSVAAVGENDEININMEEVEMMEFVRSMSILLKRNFVITSKLKGKVNIISPKPVSKEVAYSIMESVLDVYGYQIVRSGTIYKIIESSATKSEGLDTRFGLDIDRQLPSDKMITQVLPIRYINANDVLSMFQPLVSKAGYLVAHDPSNTVILTDRVSNVNRLKKILKRIDVEGSKSRIYHFRLQHADVEDLVQEIAPLFQGSGRSYTPPPSPPSKGRSSSVSRARTRGGDEGSLLVSDARTNTMIVLCSPEDYVQISRLIDILDVPTPRVRDRIHVYYLNNAVAEDIAEVLKKQMTEPKGSRASRRREIQEEALLENVQINADKATNSLVITASPEDYEILSEVIAKLDVRRSQVAVEALIVEASLDKTRELGVEWRNVEAPDPDSLSLFGGTNLPTGTQTTGSLNQLGSDPNPYSGANPAGLILGAIKGPIYWGKNAYYSIGALARALQADTDINILLTPHILTYDNEESEIIVGEERPYLKSSQTSTEGSVIRTFEFKDVGTTLRLTPHISQGDSIRLEIFTEIKNFVEQVDIGAITTTKRQIKTSVQVEDAQTVVLGGLIKEDKRKSRSMVPCLGQIYGLGWLFKANKGQSQKTNLLIFITPTIIKSEQDMQQLTEKKKEEFKEKVESIPIPDQSGVAPETDTEGAPIPQE